MTTTIETLTTLATQIAELPGVLAKRNGGKSWNGGVGRVLVVTATGSVEWKRGSEWAGAATRDHHYEIGTVDAVKAFVATTFPADEQAQA